MNGMHDLGGLTCFGPVEREDDEPVFHDDWERRVFALSIASSALFGPIDRRQHYREALRHDWEPGIIHQNMGVIYAEQNRFDEAMASYREALRWHPDWAEPMRSLALLLATHPDPTRRDAAEAVRLAERAAALSPQRTHRMLEILARAYAAAGQRAEALAHASRYSANNRSTSSLRTRSSSRSTCATRASSFRPKS